MKEKLAGAGISMAGSTVETYDSIADAVVQKGKSWWGKLKEVTEGTTQRVAAATGEKLTAAGEALSKHGQQGGSTSGNSQPPGKGS